jgi:hypothetical protein
MAADRRGLQRRHIGIGAQNEDAIKAGLLVEPGGIDPEHPLPPRCAALAQITSVGSIVDQGLLATPQRFLQGCDDRLTIEAVLLGLGLVAADHVAPAIERHFLGKQLGLATLACDQQRHERIGVLQDEGLGGCMRPLQLRDQLDAQFPH